MITSRIVSRGAIAAMAAALLAMLLMGCGADSSSSQSEVSGLGAAESPTPAAAVATPMVTATPAAMTSTAPTPTAVSAPVPPAITRALADVYANVDWFEGVVTVTANPGTPESTSMTLRQWFRKPDMVKLEVIQTSTGLAPVGTTFVYNGQTLTFYDPAENRVLEIQDRPQFVVFLNLPQERIFPHLQLFQAQQFLSSLCQQATASVDGTATVANRPTTIVDITPQHPTPRFRSARLWLDDQTKVPLKAEAIRGDGSVLVDIEYQQFDPTTEVAVTEFTFTPPTSATVLTPTPDDLANLAGFQPTTTQEAQTRAGFPVLQAAAPPTGVSLQSVRTASYGSSTVVAFFYGTSPQDISTVLIEKPATLQLPALRGAEFVTVDSSTADVYQARGMVVVDWTRGDTSLTLATTLPRDQALDIAKSVQ